VTEHNPHEPFFFDNRPCALFIPNSFWCNCCGFDVVPAVKDKPRRSLNGLANEDHCKGLPANSLKVVSAQEVTLPS
jgi:hypothetical protein